MLPKKGSPEVWHISPETPCMFSIFVFCVHKLIQTFVVSSLLLMCYTSETLASQFLSHMNPI
jgi:hypothetical protein